MKTTLFAALLAMAGLANAATYLCSDEASMITGVCMEVDGGRCI